MKLQTGGLYSLKILDFLRGAILAIGTPVLYVLQEMIPGYDLNPLLKVAISALITYLIKNFFTDKPKSNLQANDYDIGGGGIKNDPPK